MADRRLPSRPDERTRPADRPLRVVRLLAAGLLAVYLTTLLADGLGLAGPGGVLAGGGKLVMMGGLVGLLASRAVIPAGDRLAWACFAVGVAGYLAGGVLHELFYRDLPVVPRPSWADAGFMLLYPTAYTALFLMLRARLGRLTPAMWLDGVVTGLTAAALAVQFALGPAMRAATGGVAAVATSLAYPVADLLLLVLIAGALAVIGRGAGGCWWWLAGGMALFVVTDTVYVVQVAEGSYVAGGPLDLGWGLALTCLGLAACQSPRRGSARRLDGLAAIAVPGACALAASGLLFAGHLGEGDPLAGVLALGAVLAALGRTALTFHDVRALADSRRQARTDELTGLPNRRSAHEALRAAGGRLAEGGTLGVLVVDLDRFKEINDSLGHAVGDALLHEVGTRLAGQLRPGDLLARLGGDEFVVLTADLDRDGAVALAGRLRDQLRRPFRHGGMELTVDASLGLALGPEHSTDADELLQLADLAMYEAKSHRRGVTVYDEAAHGQGRHRLEAVEQLRSAVRSGELVLHYQPKLSLPTGSVDGVEALVRWQHPTRGLLFPDAFVELAESAGLMGELTTAVLDLALAQCRLWADDGRRLTVAVNVSPSNLVDEQFPDHVAALLRQHGLPASALVLEVTESLLMEDRERAVRVLARLRDSGVGIAIDDYGTGYSSLAYLAVLPVTELKLDRTFTAAMSGSARAESIVVSTLRLAHALGLVLVAEGAEDQATVDALAGIGCDVVQGYHLSRPLPPDQLWAWLGSNSAVEAPVG
ncbi:EAL domain-containing protein [Geodermatophilus sp. YIM 151500]|uniref:putative bifunctional diguanylate cyclase/phosphodiesterase n=1 Tax=Geodermatophilus sp. YIM 151500 TaxID=2984531 RepID=UPI0021E4424F|nr:EAL domain-containing protein [Geodermatophilus sp. YIM 151500]MCV2489416.1 EAL domain-containing protein [Geodermatophilus sp. YIM 151500]